MNAMHQIMSNKGTEWHIQEHMPIMLFAGAMKKQPTREEEVKLSPHPTIFMMSLENRILKRAVHNLVRMHRLAEEYGSLLQEYASFDDEAYSEMNKEIKTLLDNNVRDCRELPPYEIAVEAKILLDSANTEMDSDEIANILNLDTFKVDSALKKHYSIKNHIKEDHA